MPDVDIVIAEYDPRWPLLFQEERDRILSVIGEWVDAVEHVGSTAVPGLGAKPIIDTMVGVRRLDDASKCIEPLVSIGYKYVPDHEVEIPERRYFNRITPGAITHHLHMVETGCDFWVRHLLFRDYLRRDPEVARQYYQLKKVLAARYASERRAYTDAKTPFIESVVARARADQSDYM